MALRDAQRGTGTRTLRRGVGFAASLALAAACGADPPTATTVVGSTPVEPTTPTEVSTTEVSGATTSTTLTSIAPAPSALELEPLLLDPDAGSAPIRRIDTPLDVDDLAARPLLGESDAPDARPAPDLASALETDGFEQGLRGAAYGRSYPSLWTITIARFATPEGAARAATRLTDSSRSAPGAEDRGSVTGIAGSTLRTVPTPPGSSSRPATVVATFVVGRHLVVVATGESGEPLAPDDWITHVATLQHDQLVAQGGG